MPVSVLNAANGIGDNNSNPVAPSAGTDRYWLIAVVTEGSTFGANVPSTITVAGDTPTTLNLIASVDGATMDAALYGVNDAGIGTNPSTANGSLTYNADGLTPASAQIVVMGIVAQGVDQTTPFTNIEDDGWSVDSTNSTQNCPFTLDEIVDGLGIAFVGCSKTGTTWDLTDNGYAASGSGQWVQSTNTSGNAATKQISAQVLNQLTTFTSGLAGDKTCTLGIMLLPPASTGVIISPTLQNIEITAFQPFVRGPNLASLINDIDGYSAPLGLQTFGHALGNSSGATYRDDTQEVCIVRNGAATVVVYNLGDYTTVVKTISISFNGLSDSEDICDMGKGEFAICSEDAGNYRIHIFDWPAGAGTTATSKQNLTIAAAGADNNSGAEGVCYDRANEVFYVVGEGQQGLTDRQFFKIIRPTNTTTDYVYTDPELVVTEPFDAEVAFASLGATGAEWDLSGCDFDHRSGNVLISSDTGGEIAQIDPIDGSIIATLAVPLLTQMEGVAILPSGELMAMGEPYEYQMFESVFKITPLLQSIEIQSFNPVVTFGSTGIQVFRRRIEARKL